MQHGAESYFVVGEGLLGESVGGRERTLRPPSRPRAAVPLLAHGAEGRPATARRSRTASKIGDAMAAGGGGALADPRRLHLPRPVHRPRPHVRQDERHARRERLAGGAPAGRSPSLDLDSLYGAGPQDPESAKFYEADGIHLKMGKTVAVGGDPADGRLRPAARRRHRRAAEAQGDHPRPAQRREPRGRADAPRVHPLPQPGRRHAAGLGPGRAAVRAARELVTKHYQWMIRTDYLPRICAAGRRQRRLHQRPQGVRGRRDRRPTSRRCRSSSRSPPSGSGTR